MEKHAQLTSLIHELDEAKRSLDRLVFDEEFSHDLGEACNAKQIATLERILGAPLPPSYRAFLDLHNGWDSFSGNAKLLAVEDHASEWVKKRVSDLGLLFQEFEDEDPFKEGAIPILLGKDERDFLVLDPRAPRADGEMDLVSFDITRRERQFADFSSFLQHDLDLTKRLINIEKKGAPDEDED